MPRIAPEEITPLLDDYLSRKISPNHQEQIEDAADQLAANGTRAFSEGFGLQVAGVIVAAHHGRFIEQSLSSLALQAERANTVPAVAMSLNYLSYNRKSSEQVAQNVETVKRFQDSHPDLPLSYFVTEYEAGVPIGNVRDGVFGAAAILHKRHSQAARRPLTDLIFTNWDVDTLGATPGYFADTQLSYRQHDQQFWMAHPNTQHARVNLAKLPDANRLIAWYDLGVRAAAAIMPAHFSTNLFSWLAGKGYMRLDLGEPAALKRRLEALLPYGERVSSSHLKTSVAQVSPHRFMGQMAAGEPIGYGELGVSSEAASMPPLHYDVSANYYNEQLKSRLPQIVSAAYLRRDNLLKKTSNMNEEKRKGEVIEYARKYLRAASVVIGNVHGTERLIEERFEKSR